MKFKIKTYLWSGIIMGVISAVLLLMVPSQIRVPAYDSGAPSPRIIPSICLILMLLCSLILIFQSLVLKKEKVVEFDWEKEKPCFILIGMMCLYVFLIINIGFIAASLIIFPLLLFFCGERKPMPYVVAIIASVGIYYLFQYVFYISLPPLHFFGFGG